MDTRAKIKHQYAMKQDPHFHTAVLIDHHDRKVSDPEDTEAAVVVEGEDGLDDGDSVYSSWTCSIRQYRRVDPVSFEWHPSSHRRPLTESIGE